jgi:hypothetical protein
MYTYPSGLVCTAPAWRVRAFEGIVPPIACAILLTGMLGIPIFIVSRFDGLHSMLVFTVAIWSVVPWFVLFGISLSLLFDFVCKPIFPGPENCQAAIATLKPESA